MIPAESSAPHEGDRNLVLDLRLKQLEQRLAQTTAGAVCAITLLLDLKDENTGHHATRLAELAVQVGEILGLDERELRDLEFASMLHDIGKVAIPDTILNKPGPLNEEEWQQVKRHPQLGYSILRHMPGLERAAVLVLHHHERVDGGGYPLGLKGEEIPMGSRILAVVDAFDAMISDRSYRRGLPFEEVVRRLRESSGSQFDAGIVEPFIRLAARHLVETGHAETAA